MTDLVFVDTHVFLAALDGRDAARQAQAQAWLAVCWRQRAGRISTQVLNEFYDKALAYFGSQIAPQDARAEVRRMRLWQPPHLDTHTIEGAWSVQDRFGLSYWDALIVSSAQQQGCRHLLTDELVHLQQFDAVQAINPFEASPDLLAAIKPENSSK